MNAPTEGERNVDTAVEIVTMLRDTETGKRAIGILDETGDRVVHELDKNLAGTIAVRLVELAESLPEPSVNMTRCGATEGRDLSGMPAAPVEMESPDEPEKLVAVARRSDGTLAVAWSDEPGSIITHLTIEQTRSLIKELHEVAVIAEMYELLGGADANDAQLRVGFDEIIVNSARDADNLNEAGKAAAARVLLWGQS